VYRLSLPAPVKLALLFAILGQVAYSSAGAAPAGPDGTFSGSIATYYPDTSPYDGNCVIKTSFHTQPDGTLTGEYAIAPDNHPYPDIDHAGHLLQQFRANNEVVFKLEGAKGKGTLHLTFDKNFNEFKGYWFKDDGSVDNAPWNGQRPKSEADWKGVTIWQISGSPYFKRPEDPPKDGNQASANSDESQRAYKAGRAFDPLIGIVFIPAIVIIVLGSLIYYRTKATSGR
jgi:hypothetical protein